MSLNFKPLRSGADRTDNTDPNRLIDGLLIHMGAKNDADLCRKLEVAPPVISKVRHKRIPVGPALLLRMHDVSALPIATLREMLTVQGAQ